MALDFVAGCLGGCAGVVVGHPFDTIKVHLQTQNPLRPTYRGTFHCMQSIIQKESVLGLYRGMSSPMCGVALINAVIFGVHGNVQRRLSNPDSLKAHFLAGASAGMAQSVFCCPIELAKIRTQVQSQAGCTEQSGPLKCLLNVARHQGLRGIFRGLVPTAARDAAGIAVYFVSYEWMSRMVSQSTGQQLSTPAILLVGGLAGTVSWLSSFPVDVIKTRLQVDGMGGTAYRYKGFWDCLRQSVRTEGCSTLGRGLVSTLLRAFPTNAATFGVVTWVFRLAGVDGHAQGEEIALGSRPADVQSGRLLLGGAPLLLGATEPLYAAFHDRQQQLRKLACWPRAAPEKLAVCFQVCAASGAVQCSTNGAEVVSHTGICSSLVDTEIAEEEDDELQVGERDCAMEDTRNVTTMALGSIRRTQQVGVLVRTKREEETRTSGSNQQYIYFQLGTSPGHRQHSSENRNKINDNRKEGNETKEAD